MCWCPRPTDQVVDEVGEGPDDGHAGEGNAEQDDVQEADAQDVRQPHPSAVHDPGVGVHLAVRRAHVHDGGAVASEALHLPRDAQTGDGFSSSPAGVIICRL